MEIRKYWLLTSLGFIVLVNVVGMFIVQRSPKSILENRQLAVRLQLPKSILRSPMWFKESLAPFIQDTFLFREASIRGNRGLKLAIGDEPNNDVWTGRNGWLYLASPLVAARKGPYGDPYSDMFGDKSKLDATVEFERITRLSDICKKSSSKLIVLYPPNKETIYPEFLSTQPPIKISALDQLEAKLTTLPISVVDVKHRLLSMKVRNKDNYLFYQQDTHWNYYGAIPTALNLIDVISKVTGCNVAPPICSIEQSGERVSDLAVMNRSLDRESEFIVNFKGSHAHTIVDQYGKIPTCMTHGISKLKVLAFRDSFFSALEPVFRHLNVELVTCRSNWDYAEIEHRITVEKPDVVIFEKVERYIGD
jgi:hypothetical protein